MFKYPDVIYPTDLKYSLACLWYFVCGTASLATNLLIAKVFFFNETLRSNHHLVVSLAVSDAFAGVPSLRQSLNAFFPDCQWTSFQRVFHEIPALMYISSYYVIMLGLALFRMYSVENPLKYKQLIDKKFHVYFYVCTILYSVGLYTVSLIYTWGSEEPVKECSIRYLPEIKHYKCMILICLILICVTNFRLSLIMRRKRKDSITNPAAIKAEKMSRR